MKRWWLAMVGTIAACHGSHSSSDAPPAPTYGAPLSCSSQQVCAAGTGVPCDVTLSAAMSDAALCPASYYACGDGWTIVIAMGIDTSTDYYYQNGQLVAIVRMGVIGPHACLEGPSSFAPPSCVATTKRLPPCP
jgi:hypothetical protein